MRFTSRYAIVPHGPKRVEIVRDWRWSEVITRFDGRELGRADEQRLVEGIGYRLPDGSDLRIRVERGPRQTRVLHLSRHGRPLPGSEGDPLRVLRFTVRLVAAIAVLQMAVAGFIALVGRPDAVVHWMTGVGGVLLLLSFLAWRRSLVAMVTASALCFAEVTLVLVTQARWNADSVLRLLIALSILGLLLWRGVAALHTLNSLRLPLRHRPVPLRAGTSQKGRSRPAPSAAREERSGNQSTIPTEGGLGPGSS